MDQTVSQESAQERAAPVADVDLSSPDIEFELKQLSGLIEIVSFNKFCNKNELSKLRKSAMALMSVTSSAIEREKVVQVESKMKEAIQALRGNHDIVLAQMKAHYHSKIQAQRVKYENLLVQLKVQHQKELQNAKKSVRGVVRRQARIQAREDAGPTNRQGESKCQICFERNRDTVILPCTHFLYCNECIESLKVQENGKCPVCAQHINCVIRVLT